jgi:hypothetical protein
MAGGIPLRERFPGEACPDPCDFGCASDGECFVERDQIDLEAEAVVRSWMIAGPPERRTWPRAGGVEDQDAVVVRTFGAIDEMLAETRSRAAAAMREAT